MAIKVGVIGTGGIANYHIKGYQKAGADVVAVADLNSAAAFNTAKSINIPHSYDAAEKLLTEEKDQQAVSICVPNKFHAPRAIAAARAGKHIFCEKPPALNASEAKQMAEAASAGKVHLMFDFNNRARPEAAALKRYIDDGTAGTINSAQGLWVRRCGIPGYGGWFTQKTLSGGGPTIDLLHMLDLALWFMGYPEPAWVLGGTYSDFAHDSTFAGPWGLPTIKGGVMDVETAAHALITFKSGQTLFSRMSWAEMNQREEVSVTFQGAKAGGRIARLFSVDGVDETAIDECRLYTHENGLPVNREVIVSPDTSMGRIGAVVNFVQTIEGKAKPLSNAAEGVKLMQIIEAIYTSSQSKAPVDVSKL
jgi:predicted dehydrogenase